MNEDGLIMTLAKVLIAAAWADGEMSRDEVNNLKDVMFRMPQVSAHQWDLLDMYIESPVGAEERARLVEDLRQAIQSPENKALALAALDDMVQADGGVSPEEEQVVTEIRQAIESADTGLVGKLSRLVRGAGQKRSQALAAAPNRELYFDDFVRNKVYYSLRQRQTEDGTTLDLPDDELRKLSLAGAMMAQIAMVNPEVTEQETVAMAQALQQHWHVTPAQAALVTEVAVSDMAGQLDYFRVAREFSRVVTYEEAGDFIDVLFAVAAADGKASFEETEKIRIMAGTLKVTHERFIEAKLKIPAERR